MFGKPDWFKASGNRKGLRPATWQGWTYVLGWTAAMAVPFLGLFTSGRLVESVVWLVAAALALRWDARQMRRSSHTPPANDGRVVDDVFVIDEDETGSAQFATRGYQLRTRSL